MTATTVDKTTETQAYSILGRTIEVTWQGANPALLDRLDILLAQFPRNAIALTPAVHISVRRTERDAPWEIEQDDEVQYAQGDNALLRRLEWRIFVAAVRHGPSALILHAGAVARDGAVLLLPGPSGCGKTTLSLGLVAHGWLPLGDDICPLDDQDGELVALPCPRACHVCNTSRTELKARGLPLEGPVAGLHGLYRPVHWGSSAPVRAIVAPLFIPGAPPMLTPIFQAECVAKLITSTYAQVPRSGRDQRLTAVRLAMQAPAFRLVYSDLDDASRLVDDLMARALAGKGHR
jgi:hypothetical protein